jgi:hypothetical protein
VAEEGVKAALIAASAVDSGLDISEISRAAVLLQCL